MRARFAVVAAVLAAGLVAPSTASAIGVAVTDEPQPRLVSFDPAAPGQIVTSLPLSGLDAGETVRGLDLRSATGTLYVLTTDALGAARLRTLDPLTGAAAAPIALSADPTDATNPYTSLDADSGVGVDFNPVPDRLRIVTRTGQNLRVHPSNGFVVTDGSINPGTPQIVAVAYTNSFPGATTTTLYDYDYDVPDSLKIQNPPNNGTLVPVGPFGIIATVASNVSFDISPGRRAYVLPRITGSSELFEVNLTTGAATPLGRVGDGTTPIRGFTIAENLIGLTRGTAVASEGGGVATVTVERATPHLGARVDYTTADGSAVAGVDYDARSGTIVFAPGQVAKTIEVPLRDDATRRAARSLSVVLSNAVPDAGTTATLAGSTSTSITIADDDPPASGGSGAGGGSTDVDRVKPVLFASASEIARRSLRRRGLRVRFSCSEACTVRARLLAGRRVLTTHTTRLATASLGTLRLRPSRRAFAAIGRRRRLQVVLTATDTARLSSSFAFRVRLL